MIHVRELPSLRQYIEVITPSGRHYRWADDEPNPANIPSGLRHSSTMPGGHESCDVTLPRKPGVDYADLERLSTLIVGGAGGDVAGEFRLERTPRVSGDQMAISPSAVGLQAHLDDDKSAREIYVDRSLASWSPPTLARIAAIAATSRSLGDFDWSTDHGLGCVMPSTEVASGSTAEIWYMGLPGIVVSGFMYVGSSNVGFGESPKLFSPSDEVGTAVPSTDLTFDETLRSVVPAAIARYAMLRVLNTGAAVTPTAGGTRTLAKVGVYGSHGLTTRAIDADTPDGLLASDVVAHAVRTWAPLLNITDESVQASTFVIPHLVFSDWTTASEIVRQATRFGLQDWAVWDDRTFYWHERGARGRKWRARTSPAQLEETGPQVDRVWESVVVQYQDVDGSTRTVGPVGSGADTEDADLHDSDPENPANKLGIIRRDLLQMGVSTVAGATEIGRRFLEEQKVLDTSGRARLVGHVEDDRGMLHPYWRVRAGDQISFIDAADPSYRRIVRADHTRSDRTCSIDLDAPPEGLQALLERLGVVLIPLGL